MRVLVAIAYYGNGNRAHLDRLLDEYRSMPYDIDVVLITEAAKPVHGVEQRIGLPTPDPWSLTFAHKALFAERADDHDLFIYTEDDTLITEAAIEAFLWASSILPTEQVAGFLRTEERPDGTLVSSSVHNHFHWDPASAFEVAGHTFGRFTNPHAGSYLLTREQLGLALDSGNYHLPPRSGRLGIPETAATDVYVHCGLDKVICLDRLDDFLLPHLGNRYYDQFGLPLDELHAQVDALRRTLSGEVPTSRLFDPSTPLDDSRWDKRYHAAVADEVLAAIPPGSRVLSFGVGAGDAEGRLVEAGHEVVGIPLDAVTAVTARGRGVETTAPDLDAALDELGDRRFDVVLALRSIHHVADPVGLLGRLARLLDDGGQLLATFPNLRRHQLRARLGKEPPVPTGRHDELGVHLADDRRLASWFRSAGYRDVRVGHSGPHRSGVPGAVTGIDTIVRATAPAPRARRRRAPSIAAPPVSIGIPVYNGEDFLAECLASARAQDFDDLEIVISDNASSDATEEICRAAAAEDDRIRYHRQDRNRGAAVNYNETFVRSRGRWFAWWAHDDLRAPSFVRRCVETFEEAPPSTVLVYSRADFIDGDGDVIGPDTDVMATSAPAPQRRLATVLSELNMANAVFGLARADTLEATRLIGPFIASDYVLLAELAMLGEIHEIPETLMFRRLHEASSREANTSAEDVARWFDAEARRPRLSSKQRLLVEYSRSARRLPLSRTERLACLATVPTTMAYRVGRDTAGRWRRNLVGAHRATD